MNMAVFFQQKGHNVFVKVFRKIYFWVALRNNGQRIQYLRDAGAIIGQGVTISDIRCLGSEPYLIEIGDNTLFSSGARIITHDGSVCQTFYMGLTDKPYDSFGKVKIGKNCFVGMNSMILKNVTVGDNCIIGAGAVVTKSIPSNSVVCGVPARIIGNVEEFVEKNQSYFEDTFHMNSYEKRMYIAKHMEKYEAMRKEREIKAD